MLKGSQGYLREEKELSPWWAQQMKCLFRQMGLWLAVFFLTTSEEPWEQCLERS